MKPADDVRPLLRTFCLKCHGVDKAEGGVNYAPLLASADAALSKPRLWKRAHRRIVANEMPPEGAKQPTDAERKRLVAWMTAASGYLDCDPARRDPGPNPLRRLTRAEYENTLRDLFGLHFDAGSEAGMPADPITDGHFDTLAANLTLSPALMEKYFTAAGRIAEAVFDDRRGVDRRRIFVARPDNKVTDAEAAAKVATRLLPRAYRRPPRRGRQATRRLPRPRQGQGRLVRGRRPGDAPADPRLAAVPLPPRGGPRRHRESPRRRGGRPRTRGAPQLLPLEFDARR